MISSVILRNCVEHTRSKEQPLYDALLKHNPHNYQPDQEGRFWARQEPRVPCQPSPKSSAMTPLTVDLGSAPFQAPDDGVKEDEDVLLQLAAPGNIVSDSIHGPGWGSTAFTAVCTRQCVNAPQLFYPSRHRWTSGLFPTLHLHEPSRTRLLTHIVHFHWA